MAIGDKTNMVIYDDEFSVGYLEKIDQAVEELVSGSGGAFNLVTEKTMGDFRKKRFFDMPRGNYARRDPEDTASALTPQTLQQDEIIGPKLSRRYGPFQMTEDSFRRINEDPALFSLMLGQAYAEDRVKEMVNTSFGALDAALQNEASNVHTAAGTLDHAALISGRRTFGDKASKVKIWVTHSGAMEKLELAQLSVGSGNVADFQVYQGGTGTLGLPMFVSDIPTFDVAGTPGTYTTLGLAPGAISVFVDTLPIVALDRVLLKENIERIIQGEDDYVLELAGFKWNSTTNPTDAAVKTGSNWVYQFASNKDLPGCVIVSNRS